MNASNPPASSAPETGRIQLALNVSDLDEAISFYSTLFGTEPAKRRDGYANFAIANPPLKLVLLQGDGIPGTMNHLGIELNSSEKVFAEIDRLAEAGLTEKVEENTTCCYSVQDKVWVNAPDGEPWEVYTVKGEADVMHADETECCVPSEPVAVSLSS